MQGFEHRILLTRAYLALDRPEEARPHLSRRGTQLDALEALATEDPELELQSWFLGELPRFRGEQSVLRAELAEAESRPLDALVHYRRAQELLPAGHPDLEKAARGARLWHGLGGTDEGWAVLAELFEKVESDGGGAPPVLTMTSGWRERDTPFPPFDLLDLEGRRWRLTDLAGKTVLVNFWATWCLPCRLELPHLQKLADELADRPELTVVTLNVDENPGLVAPFIDREGFGFPALLARDFTEEHDLPGGGIPQNWILDGDGVVRRWQSGFSEKKAEGWRESVLAELEAVASGR
jgi:thiol-disulfide isomerase/thioredoxin